MCERLLKISKQANQIAEQERCEAKSREQSVADALKLRNKSDIACDEYYASFLDIVRNLLDGNMDSVQYEDTLREMFGIHAYIAFTLDKVVHNCVRQLQYLAQDECSTSIRQIYADEQRSAGGGGGTNQLVVPLGSTLSIATIASPLSGGISGSGGKVAHMSHASVMSAELAYQKRAEALLDEQNCYKVSII